MLLSCVSTYRGGTYVFCLCFTLTKEAGTSCSSAYCRSFCGCKLTLTDTIGPQTAHHHSTQPSTPSGSFHLFIATLLAILHIFYTCLYAVCFYICMLFSFPVDLFSICTAQKDFRTFSSCVNFLLLLC